MDSKGNIVNVEKIDDTKAKVTNVETGAEEIVDLIDIQNRFSELTGEQATMLMSKSRADRRKWLRENKMLGKKKRF